MTGRGADPGGDAPSPSAAARGAGTGMSVRKGVEPDVSPDEIRAAFRTPARICHPDRHQDA